MKDKLCRKTGSAIALATLLLVGGCASERGVTVGIGPESAESILLPPPPAVPRMRYLYSVQTPREQPKAEGSGILGRITWRGQEPEEPPRFKNPITIAEAGQALFYVVDQANSLLLAFEPEKKEWKFIEPDAGEPLSSLVGIAVDESGAIYLTDSAVKKVFRLQSGSQRADGFAGDYAFGRPTGIAFNPASKSIYVVDTMANKVIAFDPAGKKLLEFGQRGDLDGEFNYPTHIATDRQGNLYVSDTLNFRVQSFTAAGAFRFSFGASGDAAGQFSAPKGVAVSSEGPIYVVDSLLDRVQAFSPQGAFLFAFGTSGTAPGQFWLPNGIYVDEKDRVYVCDYLNDRVQVFQYLGAE